MAARFELRDPFAEVTYRAKTFDEMVVKADQLGAIRFIAIDEDGKRTPVHKVDGVWQRAAAASPPKRPDRAARRPAVAAEASVRVATPPAASVDAVVARIDAEAERAALVARLEAALNERYVIKRAPVTVGDVPIGQTEYRFRGDTSRVAFTESTFRLATDTNSPSVARSMVDVAEARNWKALRVSGHEDFRRMVWLEASVRGVKTLGYEPVPGDHGAAAQGARGAPGQPHRAGPRAAPRRRPAKAPHAAAAAARRCSRRSRRCWSPSACRRSSARRSWPPPPRTWPSAWPPARRTRSRCTTRQRRDSGPCVRPRVSRAAARARAHGACADKARTRMEGHRDGAPTVFGSTRCRPRDEGFADALAAAHADRQRPRCLCLRAGHRDVRGPPRR